MTLVQNPHDYTEIRSMIHELMLGSSTGVSVDDVEVRVEEMNAKSDDKLNQLAVRATIRNSRALLNGQISRDQLRNLLEQDGVNDLISGISTDDVIDYMASHLSELLDHEAFGRNIDPGAISAAMNTLHGKEPACVNPTAPGL